MKGIKTFLISLICFAGIISFHNFLLVKISDIELEIIGLKKEKDLLEKELRNKIIIYEKSSNLKDIETRMLKSGKMEIAKEIKYLKLDIESKEKK